MKKSLLTSIVCAGMLTAFGQNPYPISGLRALYEFDNSLQNAASGSYSLTPSIGGMNMVNFSSDRTNTPAKALNRLTSNSYGNATVTDNLMQFTIGGWIKLTSYTDGINLFSTIMSDLVYIYDETQTPIGYVGSYTIRVDGNGNLQAILIGGGPSPVYTILSSDAPLQLNQWYHVAWRVDKSTSNAQLYVNGTLNEAASSIVIANNPGDMYVGNVIQSISDGGGGFYTNSWQEFTGDLDELFVYETLLDTCDIKAIAETLPNFTISENNGTLEVNLSATATYAWYNCSTDQVVAGETLTTFTPSDNGEYYAVVTDVCSTDTTACLSVGGSTNGLNESLIEWSVYPNPANDIIQIEADNLESVSIIDLFGKTVVTSTSHLINVEQLAAGTYTLQLTTTGGKSAMKRLMIQ